MEQSTAGGEGAMSASGGRAFQAEVSRQEHDGLVQTAEGQCGWNGGRGVSAGRVPQGWAATVRTLLLLLKRAG